MPGRMLVPNVPGFEPVCLPQTMLLQHGVVRPWHFGAGSLDGLARHLQPVLAHDQAASLAGGTGGSARVRRRLSAEASISMPAISA